MPIQAGDLLLFHMEQEGGTGHTAMAVSDSTLVHADPVGGLCLDDLDMLMEEGHPPLRFRPNDAQVAGRAAALATLWANERIPTKFSSSLTMVNKGINEARVVGVTEAAKNPELLEFGYDALYRVFKWAVNSGERPFSANRGTTCCAFVTACFQTARALTYLPPIAIAEIFKVLTANRNAKLPKEERIAKVHLETASGKLIGRRPFPQFANAGGKISLEEAWALVMGISTKYGGPPWTLPHQLTTAALFTDAKFAVTRQLLPRLRADPVFWKEMAG